MKKLLLIPALLCAMVACVDKDYDYKDGFDKSMTLFGDELTLPMGKMDSISIQSFLKSNGIDFPNADEDGYYYYEQSKSGFTLTGLEILYMNKTSFKEKDQTVKVTSSTNLIESSMKLADQRVILLVNNPFEGYDITLSCDVSATDSKGNIVDGGSLTNQVCHPGENRFTFSIAGAGNTLPTNIMIKNTTVTVPEAILNAVQNYTMSSVTSKVFYRTGFAMPNVQMLYEIPVDEIDQEIAKYKFREIELNTEITNTVPVHAKIHDFYLVDKDGNKFKDLTLSYDPEEIQPGTIENPVMTKYKIIVKCENGFPDIKNFYTSFTLTTDPEVAAGRPININQCCVMQNSSLILRGGITVCGE